MRRICSAASVVCRLHQLAERHDLARRRHQRRLRQLFGRFAEVRAQDDGQPRLAVEVLAEPGAVAQRAHDGAERCAIPADFGDAPVVGLGSQLQRLHVRVREGLHVRAGERPLQELAAFLGRGIERCRVGGLQVDRDRARGAADAAEQLALVHEHARVGNADDDFVAHDALELADPVVVDDARADRAAARPQQDVPVLETRLLLALHVRLHALDELAERSRD